MSLERNIFLIGDSKRERYKRIVQPVTAVELRPVNTYPGFRYTDHAGRKRTLREGYRLYQLVGESAAVELAGELLKVGK